MLPTNRDFSYCNNRLLKPLAHSELQMSVTIWSRTARHMLPLKKLNSYNCPTHPH